MDNIKTRHAQIPWSLGHTSFTVPKTALHSHRFGFGKWGPSYRYILCTQPSVYDNKGVEIQSGPSTVRVDGGLNSTLYLAQD